MNERIRELIKQATTKIHFRLDPNTYKHIDDPDGDLERFEFDKEKFAELIVAECMTTVLKESKWYWDKDEFESANAIQNAARRVKEHFGVEE